MPHRSITTSAIATILLSALFASSAWAKDEPLPQTLITNVQIFDGVSEKLTPGNVLIEGNLIKQIGESISEPDATVIDGGGRTLMPGIIEAHGDRKSVV